jgi:hypothetical protein
MDLASYVSNTDNPLRSVHRSSTHKVGCVLNPARTPVASHLWVRAERSGTPRPWTGGTRLRQNAIRNDAFSTQLTKAPNASNSSVARPPPQCAMPGTGNTRTKLAAVPPLSLSTSRYQASVSLRENTGSEAPWKTIIFPSRARNFSRCGERAEMSVHAERSNGGWIA